MRKVLSVVGAKGGTLKSSTVAALADLASAAAWRVVMVDGDPQSDLTSRSGFARVADPLGAEPVVVAGGEEGGGIRLLRGGRSLEAADLAAAAGHLARAAALGADLVLVDTPPALGPLTTAAIRASDLVLVPAVPGKESLEHIHDVLAVARVSGDPAVRVVLTLAHRRSQLVRWMREEVDALYPGLRLEPVLPFEVAAGEAALYERPVTAYAPRSHNAAAYRALAAILLPHLGLAPAERRP
jgi:chromosome partitioning protein